MIRLAIAALLLAYPAFGQAPSPEEQNRFLERTRRNALDYTKLLPNFICTEVIHRYSDEGGGVRMLDTLELQLTYAGMKEEYTPLVDGKPANRSMEEFGGALSFGEFGSTFRGIFAPQSMTSFQWEKATSYKRAAATVYSYRVPAAHSLYSLGVGGKSGLEAIVGLRGTLLIDNQTGMVLRLTANAEEIPKDFPMQEADRTVEYAPVEVNGKEYVLPTHAETSMMALRGASPTPGRPRKFGAVRYRNVVEFRNYRKFEVQSNLTFDK